MTLADQGKCSQLTQELYSCNEWWWLANELELVDVIINHVRHQYVAFPSLFRSDFPYDSPVADEKPRNSSCIAWVRTAYRGSQYSHASSRHCKLIIPDCSGTNTGAMEVCSGSKLLVSEAPLTLGMNGAGTFLW